MHELALTESIVTRVSEHAGGGRVRRVTLEVGRLTCVSPDAMRFCFDVVAEGTALEGAMLEIVEIEARARCRACGAEFPRTTLWEPCPCGSDDIERLAGEELNVKEYELEVAATPPIDPARVGG